MRMKRLKHLDDRKAACENILFSAKSDELNFLKAKETKEYIDVDAWFSRKAPIWLEVGCGKGQFACELALRHPEVNIIAVEKNCNVIVQACEKAISLGINNVRFIKSGAEYLSKYLKPDSIDEIFLNFSCPFPKKSHASHRLTSPIFLSIYDELLTEKGKIHQKTDNRILFEYSIEQLSKYGFILENISLDLHNSDFEGNIVTEYEQKFVSQGLPIYRLQAYLKRDSEVAE